MKNHNYILTSNGELYHYGVKGMKWGVRRYQNKDGSLTKAGKKRYDTMNTASDKAKSMSEMARRDAEKFSKRAESAKNNTELSESQYKKAMKELFGNDSKDKTYVENEARDMGYEDSRQMAREHLGIGKDGYEIYKASADRARKAAVFYEGLSDSYKNADIASLNREQIKKAEKFVKNGYLDNLRYSDYHLDYDKRKYGI